MTRDAEPDYWDGWLNQPHSRTALQIEIRRLYDRMESKPHPRAETAMLMKRIRELSDRLKEGQ